MTCKCTMAQSLVGDGCDICNPELAREHEIDAIADMIEELQAVQSGHKDRFIRAAFGHVDFSLKQLHSALKCSA